MLSFELRFPYAYLQRKVTDIFVKRLSKITGLNENEILQIMKLYMHWVTDEGFFMKI